MIQSGHPDAQTIVNDVLKVFKDVNNMVSVCTDIGSLVTVVIDEYVLHAGPANPTGCQNDLDTSYGLILKVVDDLKQGKTMNLAIDVMQLV